MEAANSSLSRDPVLVDLGLQGGGAHGAFTWGVLDRLLEEPWLGIDGISGTSAGAMNAAVLVDGYTSGGAAGARIALDRFWRRVADAGRFSPFQRGPLDVFSAVGRWTFRPSMHPPNLCPGSSRHTPGIRWTPIPCALFSPISSTSSG